MLLFSHAQRKSADLPSTFERTAIGRLFHQPDRDVMAMSVLESFRTMYGSSSAGAKAKRMIALKSQSACPDI